MLNILYANPYSLFDHTSGSSKSMNLILKKISDLGCNVESIFCTTSYSKAGYLNTSDILKNFNKLEQINELISDKINYTIIKSKHWDRRKLTHDEQSLFFKATISIIKKRLTF